MLISERIGVSFLPPRSDWRQRDH